MYACRLHLSIYHHFITILDIELDFKGTRYALLNSGIWLAQSQLQIFICFEVDGIFFRPLIGHLLPLPPTRWGTPSAPASHRTNQNFKRERKDQIPGDDFTRKPIRSALCFVFKMFLATHIVCTGPRCNPILSWKRPTLSSLPSLQNKSYYYYYY